MGNPSWGIPMGGPLWWDTTRGTPHGGSHGPASLGFVFVVGTCIPTQESLFIESQGLRKPLVLANCLKFDEGECDERGYVMRKSQDNATATVFRCGSHEKLQFSLQNDAL